MNGLECTVQRTRLFVQWTRNTTIFLYIHFFDAFDQLNFSSISFSFGVVCLFTAVNASPHFIIHTERRLVHVSGTCSMMGKKIRSTDYDLDFHIHAKCDTASTIKWSEQLHLARFCNIIGMTNVHTLPISCSEINHWNRLSQNIIYNQV